MIDHITYAVSDFVRSRAFYDAALAPLGIRRIYDDQSKEGRAAGYGDQRPWLWIREGDFHQGRFHIALNAADPETVRAFHRAALAAGVSDNGAPGFRPEYQQGYYAAFVLDPDGNNIEAVRREHT